MACGFKTLLTSLSLAQQRGGRPGLRPSPARDCGSPDPKTPPAALTLGLSKAGVWVMVPSVRPGAALSALALAGSLTSPLAPGPWLAAARHAPLNRARPAFSPAPGPSPRPAGAAGAAHFLESQTPSWGPSESSIRTGR